MLTIAKLDATSHWWVTSLANYNFQLYYRAGKTNINADTLLRVSWPGCMPEALGTHQQVTAVAMQALQEAILKGPSNTIEAYSYELYVLDPVGDGWQVACMNADGWHQAQRADPVLSLMTVRMQDLTLDQSLCKPTDPPKLHTFLWECNHLKLRWGVLYRKPLPKDSQEAQFKLVLPPMHQETALKGCHNEASHLGLKCMLNLMCNCFIWPQMATQVKDCIERCCQCVTFKAKQQWAPLENIMATHPLELVHIDYLYLEQGRVRKKMSW